MKGRARVEWRDDVAILWLARDPQDEVRFDRELLEGLDSALDDLAREPGLRGIVSVGSDRFFSNGYDLDWLASLEREARRDFIRDQQALLARFLELAVPAVAAISGHAIGAGALFALAHDERVARIDRGFFCLPEIDAGIPLRRGMMALVKARLRRSVARDAVLTGRRYPSVDAEAAGIVQACHPAEELVGRACERVRSLARSLPLERAPAVRQAARQLAAG